MVAVCDILGFSDLVMNNELDAVVRNALGWFQRALHHSVHREEFPAEPPPLSDLKAHSNLGVAWFSDTILIYTREDSDECVQALVWAVATLLFETIVAGRTLVRGGIAYGDLHADPDNEIYVGEALIEAYRLEARQEWAGATISPSAADRIPKLVREGEFADWPLVRYDAPVKDGVLAEALVVNWTFGIHRRFRLKWSQESDEPTPDEWEEVPGIARKFTNTNAFHDAVCSTCA